MKIFLEKLQMDVIIYSYTKGWTDTIFIQRLDKVYITLFWIRGKIKMTCRVSEVVHESKKKVDVKRQVINKAWYYM